MKSKINFWMILIIAISILLGCNETQKIQETQENKPIIETPEETVICAYRENDDGMYSSYWAVNFITENKNGKQERFVELNGNKIGPFEEICELGSFSPNGKNVAFVAKEKDKNNWDIYLNGKKKWSYERLKWFNYSWTAGLAVRRIRFQTPAIPIEFSQDNKHISFFIKKFYPTAYANVFAGKIGKYYHGVGGEIYFIDNKVAYWAWKAENEQYFVIDNKEYGPYESTYDVKLSNDKRHFAYIAFRDGKNIFVLDGIEKDIDGNIETFTIGDGGSYAIVYTKTSYVVVDGEVHINQNGNEWEETFSETVPELIKMSNDANVLAGWFKRNNKWYIVANDKIMYGPYEDYFSMDINGILYGLYLGKSGNNIAYFADYIEGKNRTQKFYLNGKEIETYSNTNLIIPGDTEAVADAAYNKAENPFIAKYLGANLIYTVKQSDSIFVLINNDRYGPFMSAESFRSSQSGKNYGFIAEDGEGKFAFINGKHRSPYYDNVYRFQFEDENEVAFLTIRDSTVVRVFGTF